MPDYGISTELLLRLHNKKHQLDNCRPFSAAALRRLQKDMAIEWTYNSNSIEGNTLSLRETRVVLEDGITIGGKTLREHFEAHNHHQAVLWLEQLVGTDLIISSSHILDIHGIILRSIDDEFCGRYRNGRVRITGANFIPPNAAKVPGLVDDLVEQVKTNNHRLDILSLAAVFHHRLVWIHPFFDGNGRTARLAMNLFLMKAGYPPAIILSNDRKKYYQALDLANQGDYSKLYLVVAQAAERSLDLYLSGLGGTEEDYIPLSDLANDPEVPYGQEYLSLRARQGKLEAFKEGRVWFSSKEAVTRYTRKTP